MAEEVRKLAEGSQVAAASISQLIGEIQAETAATVTVVDDGTRRTEEGMVFEAGRLVVAGPATACSDAPALPGQPRFGVRFRVGLAGAMLGWPAGELRDRSVSVVEIWGASGQRLQDRVGAAGTVETALGLLIDGVAERVTAAGDRDRVVREAALALVAGLPLAEVARRVGLGERQLRRRFEIWRSRRSACSTRSRSFTRWRPLTCHWRSLHWIGCAP